MDPTTKALVAAAAGIVGAAIYAKSMQNVEDERHYASLVTSEVVGIAAGGALVFLGYRCNSGLVCLLGAGLGTLQVMQAMQNKVVRTPSLQELLHARIPIQNRAQYEDDVENGLASRDHLGSNWDDE